MRNTLNDLESRDWLKFQKSWFVHNPPPRKKGVLQHPAKFPETLAGEFIGFFTKKDQVVLDPMVGTGSTLIAAIRARRRSVGIELNEKYAVIAQQMVDNEIASQGKRFPKKYQPLLFNDDAANASQLDLPPVDYVLTSPPYWDMLRMRGAETQKKRRANGLDVFYSDDPRDLGNMADYEQFLDSLCNIYESLYPLLKNKAYLTIIVKNVKKGGKIYPLAWDIARRLSKTYTLKDERIWCFPPDEKIWTAEGAQPIEEITEGACVLTHRGRLEPVTAIMRRSYDGLLLKLRPALLGSEVRLTPEHEVLAIQRRHYHHANGERFSELFSRSAGRGSQWLPASELTEGDCVAFPLSRAETDIEVLHTSSYLANPSNWQRNGDWLETRGRGAHGRGRLPIELKVDDNFLRLAGWYLSEGSASVSGVNIANTSPSARQEIRELFYRVFAANTSEDASGVWCRSRSIGQLLANLFGKGAHNKRLPAFAWHLPLTKQIALLSSLWAGDGHVSKKNVAYKTTSEQLALGVAYLTMRVGAMPYIHLADSYYNLSYRGRDANMVREALNFPTTPVQHGRSQHWFVDDTFWLPIRSISVEKYQGKVYNLAVANDNSYTTLGFVVHNCQDNQRLAPFGLGSAWVSNTFHHYCLQFRKEDEGRKTKDE